MAVVNLKGSRIMTGLTADPVVVADPGEGGGQLRYWAETVEVGSADSATSTYLLAVVPSAARISGSSRVYWDDLASSGAPTLDFGLFPIVTGDFTADDDCFRADGDAATANATTGVTLITDHANFGKRAWELCGLTADPKRNMYLYATLKDAAVNVGGTLSLELYYSVA